VIILVAAALAAAILINQLSTPIQVHNPPPHQGSATVLLGQTQFITPQDALVVTKQGLLITRDGGEHWQLRLKRDNGNSLTVRVIDSNHILALSGSQLHSTADGGVTWRTTPIGSVPEATGQEGGIFFLNASEGWRLESSWPASPPGPKSAVIYHTADSGVHWTEIARVDQTQPASHGLLLDHIPTNLVFADSKRGFMSAFSIDNAAVLYVTGDGGYNWQLVALPARMVATGPTPTMFGNDGVIALQSATDLTGLFVYVTTDGGLTWTSRIPPVYGRLSVLDARHWWLLSIDGNTIYRTSDAGVTWQPGSTTVPSGLSIAFITAVSDRVLWGLAESTSPGTPGEGCGPPSSIPCPLIPIRSTDGGANWQARPLPADA